MNGKNWLHIDQNLGNKNVKLEKGKVGIIIVGGGAIENEVLNQITFTLDLPGNNKGIFFFLHNKFPSIVETFETLKV